MLSNAEGRALSEVTLWQRFHVRLTFLYAVTTFVMLGVLATVYYTRGVSSQVQVLQEKLRGIAVTLSHTLDADGLDAVKQPEDAVSEAFLESFHHIQLLMKDYPGVESIYVMRPTEDPNTLTFILDYNDRLGTSTPTGTPYDASEVPKLRQGLEQITIEEHVWRDEFGVTISGYAPLRRSDGRLVGLVGVDIDARHIDAIKRKNALSILVVFGLAGWLMVAIALFGERTLRGPLEKVIAASNAIANGQLDHRVGLLDRKDEFGLLGRHFDSMAHGLQERDFIRKTFGRFVSEDVARTLLAAPEGPKLGGEVREVTILFSDLRGYSTMVEHLPPGRVLEVLNGYLGAMNTVIDAHDGCVIEYLGDAILAVFGAPSALPDHAEYAVRCALAMRQELLEMNARWDESGDSRTWKQHGVSELFQRIGIHTGTVVAGNLGSNTRMKYGVIGDNVNVAARLEQLNKTLDTSILVSAATHASLSPALQALCENRGGFSVKGRQQEIDVYAL